MVQFLQTLQGDRGLKLLCSKYRLNYATAKILCYVYAYSIVCNRPVSVNSVHRYSGSPLELCGRAINHLVNLGYLNESLGIRNCLSYSVTDTGKSFISQYVSFVYAVILGFEKKNKGKDELIQKKFLELIE